LPHFSGERVIARAIGGLMRAFLAFIEAASRRWVAAKAGFQWQIVLKGGGASADGLPATLIADNLLAHITLGLSWIALDNAFVRIRKTFTML
jgi:hypothetical protein